MRRPAPDREASPASRPTAWPVSRSTTTTTATATRSRTSTSSSATACAAHPTRYGPRWTVGRSTPAWSRSAKCMRTCCRTCSPNGSAGHGPSNRTPTPKRWSTRSKAFHRNSSTRSAAGTRKSISCSKRKSRSTRPPRASRPVGGLKRNCIRKHGSPPAR